jgi:hypothetical protein
VGKTIILQKPISYARYFILPNIKEYCFPQLEAYETYFDATDTIPAVATNFYEYSSNKIPDRHPLIYTIIFKPWPYIFPVANGLFIVLALWYLIKKKYKKQQHLFNKALLIFSGLFITNFIFMVVLAPIVLRYNIFILTLIYPFIFHLIQIALTKEETYKQEL